jgi:hypothetical protein
MFCNKSVLKLFRQDRFQHDLRSIQKNNKVATGYLVINHIFSLKEKNKPVAFSYNINPN